MTVAGTSPRLARLLPMARPPLWVAPLFRAAAAVFASGQQAHAMVFDASAGHVWFRMSCAGLCAGLCGGLCVGMMGYANLAFHTRAA